MTTARFHVGDVRDVMATMADGSFDLILTSPPFLALRAYLPDGHDDKAREIGAEADPAAYLDTLLGLTAEWGRVLAPHGSIAVELGDTYSGSGGAGGDYRDGRPRAGQGRFRADGGPGWPPAKSLCLIPALFAASLAYGRNVLTGARSPAGPWLIRNLKPWIRSNPPVGVLADKERPATSYVIVATRDPRRFFDLDAVRVTNPRCDEAPAVTARNAHGGRPSGGDLTSAGDPKVQNQNGAPPLDWWHHVDAAIDAEIERRETIGARGVHIRRALERAGILDTLDALDVSPRGYRGAHYAVWPPELVRLLLAEMCPRRVCATCGEPSRRMTAVSYTPHGDPATQRAEAKASADFPRQQRAQNAQGMSHGRATRHAVTAGWSDCGHDTWRPGRVLDPFVGSGTTLAVATGMGVEADGIDLNPANVELARARVGMFLDAISA